MSTTNLPFYIVLIGAIALVGFLVMQEPDDTIASEYPIPAGNDYSRDAGNPASDSRLLTSGFTGRVGSAHADSSRSSTLNSRSSGSDSTWSNGHSAQSEESDNFSSDSSGSILNSASDSSSPPFQGGVPAGGGGIDSSSDVSAPADSSSGGSSSGGGSSGGGSSGGGSGGSSSDSSPPSQGGVPAGGEDAASSSENSKLTSAGSMGGGGGATQETVVEKLKKLKPLPKVHYSWGLDLNKDVVDNRDSELMYQFARLTHSVGLSISPHHNRVVASKRIDNAVYTCARINKTNPDIPCSIVLNYSPWHWKFMLDENPNSYNFKIFSNPTYQAEIKEFVDQMIFMKQQVAKGNQYYDTDVKISALLLDCERFSPRKNDSYWNEAMAKALDDIHQEAIKLFPDARIEWYGRGMGGYTIASLSEIYSYFTTLEKYKPTLSYDHYVVPDVEFMRQIFRKTCELADSLKIKEITPWVGLAWGRKRTLGKVVFEAWDYDVKYSYQAGQELNDFCKGVRPETYPAYNRVGVIILYTPFDPQIPDYGKHFIEYCKGAASANQ